MVSAGAAWGSPQSQIGLHRAGEANGPEEKDKGHMGPSSVSPPVGLPEHSPPEDALSFQTLAPGMGRHLHFLCQLQQGNVITVELSDPLILLGKDVKPRGDHHLIYTEVFAPLGLRIPWEQYGRLGWARAPEGARG